MSAATFRDLHQQVMKLYLDNEHTQAFELVEQERTTFPEHANEIAYWRLCFHTLLGKQAEALHIFRETLDQGGWFAPAMLEWDPDLVELRALPAFQEMAEVCRQRLAQHKEHVQPELLIEQPAPQATVLPLLIALHGNSGNARETTEKWRAVTTQGWLLGVPTSSQIIGPNEFVWDEREPGINEVRAHLDTLNRAHCIDPERVILGGYSMGAGLAVWIACHQTVKTRGFVVLAPYLTPAELEALPALLACSQTAHLRGSILVGEKDTHCLEASQKIVEIMHAHRLPCELEIHPGMDHFYPPSFEKFLSKGLAFIEQD